MSSQRPRDHRAESEIEDPHPPIGLYRPQTSRPSFGWARGKDLQDSASQERAPRGVRGQYDPTGEQAYAEALENFEQSEHFGADIDHLKPGPHTGRGPRGYRRADERIHEDVCDRLTEAGDVDATDIEVKVLAGVVTLSGSVTSRNAKRHAEDLAEGVRGVIDVQNQLRIQPNGKR
jgi:osmotically-inducible protein OsmY